MKPSVLHQNTFTFLHKSFINPAASINGLWPIAFNIRSLLQLDPRVSLKKDILIRIEEMVCKKLENHASTTSFHNLLLTFSTY